MEFKKCFAAEEWQPIPTQTKEPEKSTACFDCSICLDFASDPVVTLCGHLYCWPCIYKWFDSQTKSKELPQCPICKAEISEKTMVPLYGRGQSFSETEPQGKVIPPRPSACNIKALKNSFKQQQQQQQQQLQIPHREPYNYQNRNNFANASTFSHPHGSAAMPLFHLTPGVFGEMIYARVFGNSQMYLNSYNSVGSRSPRMRRRELQAEESLSRVSVFLFCFFLMCLLVF